MSLLDLTKNINKRNLFDMKGIKTILRNFWLVIKSWVESNFVTKAEIDSIINKKVEEKLKATLDAEYVSETGTIKLSVDSFAYDDSTGYIRFVKKNTEGGK